MRNKYIVGIDLGATNLKIGIILNKALLYKHNFPTQGFTSKEALIEGLTNNLREIVSYRKISSQNIAGIGLGVPGPVDFARGVVHFFPNIQGWHNVDLKRILERKLKLPLAIDNDANCMVLAEARLGAAKGKKNVVGITLGTGVGGGIIVEGQLYRGSSFVAGEIGHIPINAIGPKCNCGGMACLERYIGNRYILEKAQSVFGPDITLERLSLLAKEGNRKAIAIWDNVALCLGVGLTGVINFFNPEAVVIGGGIAKAGKLLFDRLEQVVKQRAMAVQAKTVKILKAKLGSDAGMVGSGLLLEE